MQIEDLESPNRVLSGCYTHFVQKPIFYRFRGTTISVSERILNTPILRSKMFPPYEFFYDLLELRYQLFSLQGVSIWVIWGVLGTQGGPRPPKKGRKKSIYFQILAFWYLKMAFFGLYHVPFFSRRVQPKYGFAHVILSI